ncbi:MAG: hypothetical protein Q8R25_00075 [bacterium]|nr:hypothetical protein [bacterium]
MDPNREMMNDIYKMTKENNQMLHGMRRRALIGGLLKFIIWTVLLLAPIWFYMAYLNDSVQKIMSTFSQVQATGASAQVQLDAFQKTIRDLQSKIPGF